MVVALTTGPGLYFEIIHGAFNGPRVLCFLVDILKELPGKILLVWDNASIHRTAEIKGFLRRPDVTKRLEVMALPPYAPELNPEELINAYIKAKRLAGFAPKTTDELKETAEMELSRAADQTVLLSNILTSSKHGLLDKKDLRKANL